MNRHVDRLKKLFLDSAQHIDEYGHHQFDMWEGQACCIMGAPRMIDNESSYAHISRHVLAKMGYDEVWNDKEGRTKEEVVEALVKSSEELGEDHMESTYGPEWGKILDFVTSIDDWSEDDFKAVERTPGIFYPPEVFDNDGQYTAGLASYLATVMTSGKAIGNSTPYKNLFDKFYKGEI